MKNFFYESGFDELVLYLEDGLHLPRQHDSDSGDVQEVR